LDQVSRKQGPSLVLRRRGTEGKERKDETRTHQIECGLEVLETGPGGDMIRETKKDQEGVMNELTDRM